MGLLDNLERGLEKAARTVFTAGGSRAVKPVEIASALRHSMDRESLALSEGHTVAPNDFVVHFAPSDFERARGWGSTLASELCDEVIRHADSQGYSLPGSVRVAFHPDEEARTGELRVVARLDDGSRPRPAAPGSSAGTAHGPGSAARIPARLHQDTGPRLPRPAAHAAAPPTFPVDDAGHQPTVVVPRTRPAAPVLEVEGRRHRLDAPSVVIGRSADLADVVLSDATVSREHARLVRTADGGVSLIDLGSRNGVLVNGRRADGTVSLRDGDRVTVGRTDLVLRTTSAGEGSRA